MLAFSLSLEEDVEVELVELTRQGHRAESIGQLVGHQHHAGQGGVGIVRAGPGGLGVLLVAVGPVEDLFLDELARTDGAEGRAGQVEVGIGGDGQDVLVEVGQPRSLGKLPLLLVLGIKEVFGILAPGAVVVFVQDDAVPVPQVYPFVPFLDAARLVAAQQVLERTEAHHGAVFVYVLRCKHAVTGDELPALEILMGHQVRFPGIAYGGLEGQHQQACPAHAPGQLVGGEGLAEAHLAVPKEVGRLIGTFPAALLEVGCGFVHGGLLFGAHPEGLGTGHIPGAVLAEGLQGAFHIPWCATHPFACRVLKAIVLHEVAQLVVCDLGAIVAHGGRGEVYPVGAWSGPFRGILLGNALLHGLADGLAYL